MHVKCYIHIYSAPLQQYLKEHLSLESQVHVFEATSPPAFYSLCFAEQLKQEYLKLATDFQLNRDPHFYFDYANLTFDLNHSSRSKSSPQFQVFCSFRQGFLPIFPCIYLTLSQILTCFLVTANEEDPHSWMLFPSFFTVAMVSSGLCGLLVSVRHRLMSIQLFSFGVI